MKHCKRHLEHILEKGDTEKNTKKREDKPFVLALLKAGRKEDRKTEQKEEGTEYYRPHPDARGSND